MTQIGSSRPQKSLITLLQGLHGVQQWVLGGNMINVEDLHEITAPLGLLDSDTRTRLYSWKYGYEVWI